jgi:hypothetical protein
VPSSSPVGCALSRARAEAAHDGHERRKWDTTMLGTHHLAATRPDL